MPVIAMNQEMGSLGLDVCAKLAEELNLDQATHEVADHVADRLHAKKSLIRRVAEGKDSMLDRMRLDSKGMAIYAAEEVFDLAAKGNVILRGWGSTYLLRNIAHIPCIRICAPLENRKQWLMKRLDTDDEELVEDELERSDAAHRRNMQARFGVEWGDPLLYDVVLNTNRMSIDGCVAQIKALLALPEFQETEASRTALANAALEGHARAALRESPDTEDVNIWIQADGGHITLRGIVYENAERKAAEKVVANVAGVTDVDGSELKIIRPRMRDGE